MKNKNVEMPRLNYVPGTEQGVSDVVLTKPSQINAGRPSSFPLSQDQFKGLNYQTAAASSLNNKMAEYYAIMNKIMLGSVTSADLSKLEVITSQIREYTLTDEDYNLIIAALQNMQTYILRFMYNDLNSKAGAMDTELNKVIAELNNFMSSLEQVYSKSPNNYPIPNKSIYVEKTEDRIQQSIKYNEGTEGIVISDAKPTPVQNRSIVWFNTGAKI